MIVSLLLAAGLAASPPPRIIGEAGRIAPVACPAEGAMMTRNADPALLLRPQDRRGRDGARSLKSMPPADLQLTVLRSVAGCALSTVVRENVEGDGRFAAPR